MDKTTRRQRLEIAWQTDDVTWQLDVAYNLVHRLYEDYYSTIEMNIGPTEYDATGNALIAAREAIGATIEGLRRITGQVTDREVEEAERLLEQHKADTLFNKLSDRLRDSHYDETIKAEMDRLSLLPDAEAIPLLEKYLAK